MVNKPMNYIFIEYIKDVHSLHDETYLNIEEV